MKKSGELISRLRGQGFRLTPQRMMILSAIEDGNGHICAEEIYAQVTAKYPHVNISTVYRTLELLKKLGLVIETDLGDGRLRYHSTDKGHHHHLVCKECGAIIDIDESTLVRLQDVLLHQYNFSAELKHVAIFGLCEKCQK